MTWTRGQALIASPEEITVKISHVKTVAWCISEYAGEQIIQSEIISVRISVYESRINNNCIS